MKTVVLVDPFDQGHHLSFMRLFTKSLSEGGYKLIVLYPNPEKIKNWVEENCPAEQQHIIYHAYQLPEKIVEQAGRFNDALTALNKWRQLKKLIKKIEKEQQVKADHLFLAWLDSYLANYLLPPLLDTVFRYKWSGLYFHPRHLRINAEQLKDRVRPSEIDYILSSNNCTGVAVHDLGICEMYSKRLFGKKIVLFPEIADDSTPNNDFAPAIAIKEKAKGRLAIGMVGMLDRMKGMKTLIEAAKALDPSDYFFVFAGPLDLKDYAADERAMIENFFSAAPENIFTYFDYLQEGGDFNAVFVSLDIIFLVYEDFASSSNRLTKAAIFEKPVIAQNRFCVGEDVEKFQLGLTIEEGNVTELILAIKKLKENKEGSSQLQPQFKIYKAMHAENKLLPQFKALLS